MRKQATTPDNVKPRPAESAHEHPTAGPAAELEPTVRPAHFSQIGIVEAKTLGAENIELILDVPLTVTVELGRTTMTIGDILALGPGALVELDKLAGGPVDVVVNERLIAKGEVVVIDENFGVRLTDIVSRAKRVNSLAS